MTEKFTFLSQDWVHEVTKVVQSARAKDQEFKEMTSKYNLSLLYVITDSPPKLRELYSNKEQLVFFVQLEKGAIRKLWIGTEHPKEKVDFTITSSYSVAKQIFMGEVSLGNVFINRRIKVEPMSKIYRRPRFTAQSIVIGNMIFKIAGQVPTGFVTNGEIPEEALLPKREQS